MNSLGREPQVRRGKKRKAAERRQKNGVEWPQLTLQPQSVAPPGLNNIFYRSWGSRPRLNICRASGAWLIADS